MPRWAWIMVAALSSCSAPENRLPEEYRRLAVPVERLQSASARLAGKRLFVEHCALCHGERGDGRGRRSLSPPAADFTARSWRAGATPAWVFYRIREGVPGTAMPSWRVLSEEACWDLAAYVLSAGEREPDRRRIGGGGE